MWLCIIIIAISDHDVDLTLLDLDSPCLTSTQKTSRLKHHERFFDVDLASEPTGLADAQAANGFCHPIIHHVGIRDL